MDVADYVIDNCGVVGDAVVELEGYTQRVATTSTVVGAALMQALVVETVRILLERGRRAARPDQRQRGRQHRAQRAALRTVSGATAVFVKDLDDW